MGSANTEDKHILLPWFMQTIDEVRPQRLIFLGDTYDLILRVVHRGLLDLKNAAEIVADIIAAWPELYVYLRQSCIEEIIFLLGEHDHAARSILAEVLRRALPGKRIIVGEYWYDRESKTLVFHGSQIDGYNVTYTVDGEEISCTAGLTVAIDAFLSQTPEIERRIRRAAEQGIFSYWYAFGKLPQFLRAANQLFGCDPKRYAYECAQVMRGGALDRWLACQSDWQVKLAGRLVKIAALYPPLLLWFYAPFYALLNLKKSSRLKNILAGRRYTDEPEELLMVRGSIDCVVTGHFHKSDVVHYREGSVYNIGCPRLSIAGIDGDELKIFRDFDYVLIDGSSVSFHSRRDRKAIPLKAFEP